MSLQHLKGYVDEQVFVILGQMESSTKITDYLYLVGLPNNGTMPHTWDI